MSFKLGNTTIGELYVGSNKIAQAYLGSNLVYQATSPGPSFEEVTIGTQTWMAKNLAIDDGGGGITAQNNVSVNGVDLGTQYYYNWSAANRVANTIDGWHLPTKDEFNTLITYIGGNDVAGVKLKSTTAWNNNSNGTDDYGFTVFPAGQYAWGSLSNLGKNAYLWSTWENDTYNAYYGYFSTGASISLSYYSKSVRMLCSSN